MKNDGRSFVKFWKWFGRRDVLVAAKLANERRTRLLVDLAAERHRLEARLVAITLAETELIYGAALAPQAEQQPMEQPVERAESFGEWYSSEQDFQREPTPAPPTVTAEKTGQSASIFTPEAVAEVREPTPESTPTAEPLPFAQHFSRGVKDERRREYIAHLLNTPNNVPVP